MKADFTRYSPASYSPKRNIWLLSILLISLPVLGQTITGSLQVRITDPSGAAVPGATVTITDQTTGQSITKTTSDTGMAEFTNLKVGTYRVHVEVAGFAVASIGDVRISPGQAQSVDLQLGGTSAVIVSTEQTSEISALPNFNNDLTPLLQVVPGAVATGSSALGKIVIDGKGKDQLTVRIDGLDATQLVDLPAGDPTLDVLASFQKPEVAFDADHSNPKSRAFVPLFGPGTGTVVDGVSFSGINTWRAQVYGEHRNGAFNARNFFDFEGKDPIRRSRFGGKAGGALVKDKALLYMAYDGVRGRTERPAYEAVPIDALCTCGSGLIAPLMRSFIPNGTTAVSGASLNPDFLVARRVVRSTINANSLDARLDAPSGSKTSFTFRFTRQASENFVPDGVTGRRQHQNILFNNGLAKLERVETKSSHTVRFGINQTRGRVETEALPAVGFDVSRFLISTGGTVQTIGLPGQPATVSIATLGGLVKGIGRGFNIRPTSFIAGYDFTRQMDSLKMSFGLEARFIRLGVDRLGGLTYNFPDISALRAGNPSSVTYLSDLSSQSPFSSGAGFRHVRQNYYLSYFQMEWPTRDEPRLSLTYGFRYDYFGTSREHDNRAVLVDPQAGTILSAGTPFYGTARNNFQPRLSLAYKPADAGVLGNAMLRVGVGVYSGIARVSDLLLPVESDRFSTGVTGGTFPLAPELIIRNFLDNPETRQFQPLAFARHFRTPERAYKWEASLTQTIKGTYDLKVLYNGNVGRNLPVAGIANRIMSVQTNVDPTKPAVVVRQFDIVRNGEVLKPFGEFFYRSSEGRSSYNGLSIQLARNKKPGTTLPAWLNPAEFSAQYTLSSNRGNVSGTVASDPFNFNSDYGYNAADARHSFTISSVYNLWQAVGLDAVKGRTNLLAGWKIIPSLTARSGFPLLVKLDRPDVVYLDGSGNVFSSPAVGRRAVINTPGGGGTGASRFPDLRPGVNPYLRNNLELLDPNAFAIPAPGSLGNLKRGALRGEPSVQLDLGLTRFLFQKEKTRGELRIDIFNIFNHANFNNPTVSLPNALGTSAIANQIQPGVPFTRASAGAFGVISAADAGRVIQFSLTFRFNDGFTK